MADVPYPVHNFRNAYAGLPQQRATLFMATSLHLGLAQPVGVTSEAT
jgi:hypothetical protein